MSGSDLTGLRVRVEGGVAWVTLDHPPINLLDLTLMRSLSQLSRRLEADDEVRVAVFESANPDFFIAHADVAMIREMPTDEPEGMSGFQRVVERYRKLSKVTIAKLEGCARGGGSEFLLSLDMRFAARGRALVSQPEVGLGILPGGSGTQRLPRLLGRSRALEVVLGCDDFDADLAERYGWINRAFDPPDLAPFVERLAARLASFPAEALVQAKRAVLAAEGELEASLTEENRLFHQTLRDPAAQRRMAEFLAAGGQTKDYEMRLAERLAELRAGSAREGESHE
ncbi:MAG: enoyl-CoA hydratase/isomerase family protein [Myxococcales bacterium]|nr:enoyl-CoA hydratase/isomerase family protein [Myxococcales bacterium]